MDSTVLLDRERIEHLPHILLTLVRRFGRAHTLVGIDLSVDAIDHLSGRLSWSTITDIVDFERDVVMRSISESTTSLFQRMTTHYKSRESQTVELRPKSSNAASSLLRVLRMRLEQDYSRV